MTRPTTRMRFLTGAAALLLWPAAAHAQGADPRAMFAVLGGGLAFAILLAWLFPLVLFLSAMAPGPVSAARKAVVRSRVACLGAGVGVTLLAFIVAAVLKNFGAPGAFLSGILLALWVLALLLGLPALGGLVGDAFMRLAGRTASPLATLAWGLAVLLLACGFPVVGWVLFLLLCFTGFGGVVIGVLSSARRPAAPLEEEEEDEAVVFRPAGND